MISNEFLIECPLIIFSILIAETAIIANLKSTPIFKKSYLVWILLPAPFLLLCSILGFIYEYNIPIAHSMSFNLLFGTVLILFPISGYSMVEAMKYILETRSALT